MALHCTPTRREGTEYPFAAMRQIASTKHSPQIPQDPREFGGSNNLYHESNLQ